MAFVSELKKDFQKLIAKNNLAQGYILFGFGRRSLGEGDSSDDKFIFAQEVANYLETKKWEEPTKVLLDCRIAKAGEYGGGIDAMRSASQFLWQKPVLSSKRTLIIDHADSLTDEAQNAILKISEEPPQHALIILLLKSPEALLPALQSRFQKIYIHSQNDNLQAEANSRAQKFLESGTAQRKEILKSLLEDISEEIVDKKELDNFVAGIIAELYKNKEKNWLILKELLHRWTLINQFNVNKRLQLEAALIEVKGF